MSDPFVNEGASRSLRVSFFDDAGVPVVPSSIVYRLDCLTTGAVVVNDASEQPAAVITIEITGDQNRIINSEKSREKKRLTVVAGYVGGVEPQYFDYWVKNLSGI